MSEIYFIRHGQASFGADNYDCLSPVGIRQSNIVADHLADLDIGFEAVYCGRMQRQQDTARPLCLHHARRNPAGGRWISRSAFDEWDGRALLDARAKVSRDADDLTAENRVALFRDRKAFHVYFTQTIVNWFNGDFDDQSGIEPWTSFRDRVRAAVEDLIKRHGRGKRIAVFTSSGPIAVVIQTTLGLSDHKTVDTFWQIMNASLTCIKYNDSGLGLSMFNNTTPLLLAKDPALLTYL